MPLKVRWVGQDGRRRRWRPKVASMTDRRLNMFPHPCVIRLTWLISGELEHFSFLADPTQCPNHPATVPARKMLAIEHSTSNTAISSVSRAVNLSIKMDHVVCAFIPRRLELRHLQTHISAIIRQGFLSAPNMYCAETSIGYW